MVSLTGIVLGWQLLLVRTRIAMLIAIHQKGGHFFNQRLVFKTQPPSVTRLPEPAVPFWRRWLGDSGIGEIRIADDDSRSNSEVQKWFPEAYIYRYSEAFDENGNRRAP